MKATEIDHGEQKFYIAELGGLSGACALDYDKLTCDIQTKE